jgi:hypothetical protein
METIELPLLPMSSELAKAIGSMKEVERSACVVLNENKAWVLRATPIILGYLFEDLKRLQDIEEKFHVVVPTVEDLRNLNLDWAQPRRARDAFETWLQKEKANYGLASWPFLRVQAGIFVATIITPDEKLAAEIGGGPVLCYCSSRWRHPCPKGPPGGNCPTCNALIKCCG